MLEQSKPAYPPGSAQLDYLLKTPFRYHPPRLHGSRFGRASPGEGVFYAAEQRRTALAEHAFWQRRFFAASPGTPLPRLEVRLTVFSIEYDSGACLDLTKPPLSRYRDIWTDPDDYTQTQALGDRARAEGVDMLRYESVRD
ncbi:MAG TPA: RES family NAD+ phosphorylase, partial [Thiohalobacter sp.]|nr:RES family NAD+ phosphorylase [Thiohalobacter sp.]